MNRVELVDGAERVVLHGGRVFPRVPSGERVLARNLATNPSFEEASGEVVVRENLAPYTRFIDTVGWSTARADFSADPDMRRHEGGPAALKSVVNVNENGVYTLQGTSSTMQSIITPGQQFTAGLSIYAAPGAEGQYNLLVYEYDAAGTLLTPVLNAPPIGIVAEEWRDLTYTFTPKANTASVRFGVISNLNTIGQTYWICEPFAVMGYYSGVFFDGSTPAAGDFSYEWSGTPNASTSLQVAQGVAGAVGGNLATAYRSKEWSDSGSYSVLVTGGLSAEITLTDAVAQIEPGKTYTVRAKAKIGAVSASNYERARSIMLWYRLGGNVPVYIASMPNEVGEHEMVGTFSTPPDAAIFDLRLVGSQDVLTWFDSLRIHEGEPDNEGYFDKDTPDADPIHYREEADGTVTKYQQLYTPTPEWVFEDLIGWRDLTDDKVAVDERPQGHGAYAVAKSFRSSLAISMKAHILGDANSDVVDEFDRVAAFGADHPVEMRVTDSVRTTSRMVSIRAAAPEDDHGHSSGTLTFDFLARDPRRYSVDDQWVTGSAAKPSGGLVWPAVWPLVWAGEQGSDGRITLHNEGRKLSSPVYRVYGGYDGFTLTNVDTQQRVGLRWTVPAGSYVELNFAARTAMLDGQADVTRYLTVRQWWDVPPGKSVTTQLEVDSPSLSPYFAGMVRSAW